MTTLQLENLIDHNQVDKYDFESLVKILFNTFKNSDDNKSLASIHKKEEVIDSLSNTIEIIIKNNSLSDKKEKLFLINFLDKLNIQKEILEIKLGEMDVHKTKLAGKRLGKKSQSAFETK